MRGIVIVGYYVVFFQLLILSFHEMSLPQSVALVASMP